LTIFRVTRDPNNPYVMLNKQFIYDRRLSFKAKGILAYILSRPDHWQIYEIEIIKHSRDGRDSVRTGIKELINLGYVIRQEKRDEKGRFEGYEYEVFEVPKEELPKSENPTSDNQTLVINELSNKLNNVVVNAFEFYEQNFGVLNPFISQSIGEWVDDLNEELVIEAMKITLKQQKKWKYCEGILKDWYNKNIRTIGEVQVQEKKPTRNRKIKEIDWEAL
jgi:DnaD/phage-associated family protein